MIPSNLAYEYVSDIPWDKDPAFAFSDDSAAYIAAFHSVVGPLPIGGSTIAFEEDIWDFNQYIKDKNGKELKVNFTISPMEIKDCCKFFILHSIMGKKKISTANLRYSNAVGVINNIMTSTGHNSVFTITTEDYINEIEGRNAGPSTVHNLYESVYQVFYFLVNNYHMALPVDLKQIKKLGIEAKNLSKQQQEESKLPNIPEVYFNKILHTALEVMRDETTKYNSRATACIIVMLSQLGLRLGDTMALTTAQLFSKNLKKSGNIAYYIHYKERKPSKPHAPLLEFDIFSNSLCTEAYETLKRIRKQCIFSQTEKYLYILDHMSNAKDEYPVPNHRFNKEYKRFMFEYMREDAAVSWDGITPSVYYIHNRSEESGTVTTLYLPDTRQYRVHISTSLYNKGISLVYIQKYMGHLSESMLGYYVRPRDTYQENVEYSERVIKEIAGDDLTPLGNGLIGEEIKANIKQFIQNNGFNVNTDVKAIVQVLGDKVVIRGKTGGVCIKTSLMPCSRDARSNEMMCAYNLCPNLFHFYYMIDVTYMNFQTLQHTYIEAKESGHSKAAQKELHKLKEVIRRRLEPEMKELAKEIERKGTDDILIQYPTLSDIIQNKDVIKEEMKIWLMNN